VVKDQKSSSKGKGEDVVKDQKSSSKGKGEDVVKDQKSSSKDKGEDVVKDQKSSSKDKAEDRKPLENNVRYNEKGDIIAGSAAVQYIDNLADTLGQFIQVCSDLRDKAVDDEWLSPENFAELRSEQEKFCGTGFKVKKARKFRARKGLDRVTMPPDQKRRKAASKKKRKPSKKNRNASS